MASLYKRATPSQQRILRIVEGAVKNAADGHGLTWPHNFARSIAKRAAGTLTAQWPEVLAAKTPSDRDGGSPPYTNHPRVPEISRHSVRRARTFQGPRSPLDQLWKDISKQCGAAKRANDQPRLETLIDVLKMIDKRRQK